MSTSNRVLEWFNWRSRHNRRLNQMRASLAQAGEWHLWSEHPNSYRDKDIGYQTICGQRVKVTRVYETDDIKGPNWIVLDKTFDVNQLIG